MMKSATFLSMLTLVFAVSVCAAAGQSLQPGDPDQAGFELSRRMDTTRDGFVSRDEWERFFTDHDKDNDGQLSLEELRLSLRVDEEEVDDADHGRLAAFERLDANTSDLIEPEEWPGKAVDFQYIDSNRDGVLSREEFLSRKARWWNERFENLDLNGDGIITRSEWLDSTSVFDRLDRNRNGVLDRREFYNPR